MNDVLDYGNLETPMPQRLGFFITFIVLVMVGGLVIFYAYMRYSLGVSSASSQVAVQERIEKIKKERPEALIQATRAGDYANAKQELIAVLNDSTASSDKHAIAIYNSNKVDFLLTGDPKTLLTDIQNIKKVILDPAVTPWVRVQALNLLSYSFCRSGRDPEAFKEIYKDAPFNKYLAAGDPDLSARQLAEWSYSQIPTAFAAVRIARWYSENALAADKFSTSTREGFVSEAKKYVGEGATLDVQERTRDTSATDTSQYASYLYWRAFAIANVALFEVRSNQKGPFIQQYSTAFEGIFKHHEEYPNKAADGEIYFARCMYALALTRIGNNMDASRQQLHALSEMLSSVQYPERTSYARMLRSEHMYHPKNVIWRHQLWLMSISPEYKALIERLLAIPEYNGKSV